MEAKEDTMEEGPVMEAPVLEARVPLPTHSPPVLEAAASEARKPRPRPLHSRSGAATGGGD
ncbi:hypothetical protein TcasGA2_TC033285 [Tribolium castaneum]|uniref:Uncharacterized protein n=1 Tax=Tribolium castaneum TaxID=7070 RepID=A0A139W8J9_TRICA|nr:hypothetical protein TcasGA2_TC033285 [Tribolium castaneum]